jgi:hypothetical protein
MTPFHIINLDKLLMKETPFFPTGPEADEPFYEQIYEPEKSPVSVIYDLPTITTVITATTYYIYSEDNRRKYNNDGCLRRHGGRER